MVDWHSSMQQTFEYYTVDPGTWKDVNKIDNVKSCTINRDSSSETLGSATIDITETLGESYIRAYLVTIQKGLTEKHPLGTFLIQTPSSSFDGKSRSVSIDAYTPLLELKESLLPIGFALLKDTNIMDSAYVLVRDHVRAPVVEAPSSERLYFDFVADINDTRLSFTRDLIANAKHEFDLDEMGRILFSPKQETVSLQPVWTYNDDNSSILYSQVTVNHDLYKIPNVVEVVHSTGSHTRYARVINDDENSPTSIINRGREIIHRVTDPDLVGTEPTDNQVKEYAMKLLRELSTVEYTISYTHGYCPVRPGNCVRFNYNRAGLTDIKAKVISQSIKCEPGCPVSEKAIFTAKLWE